MTEERGGKIESRCNAKEKYLHKMSVSFCGRKEKKQPYPSPSSSSYMNGQA
jgi:hypothetical protein